MSRESYKLDMCNGPVLPKVIAFSLPLMLSGCLQLLFNAADVIVVGRFAGKESLAAVGSTSSLTNLLINLFIGLSIGTNVVVGHTLGSGDEKSTRDNVHTAVSISILSGLVLILIGILFTRPLLVLMGAPDDVLDKAAVYLKIIFIGIPATMVYNFGSAILRATGDTKRPLYFLSAAGIVNIVLNLFFVIRLHMDGAGVALATILAQICSWIFGIFYINRKYPFLHIRKHGICPILIDLLRRLWQRKKRTAVEGYRHGQCHMLPVRQFPAAGIDTGSRVVGSLHAAHSPVEHRRKSGLPEARCLIHTVNTGSVAEHPFQHGTIRIMIHTVHAGSGDSTVRQQAVPPLPHRSRAQLHLIQPARIFFIQ